MAIPFTCLCECEHALCKWISCTTISCRWGECAASDVEISPQECTGASPEMRRVCCFPTLCNTPKIGVETASHIPRSVPECTISTSSYPNLSYILLLSFIMKFLHIMMITSLFNKHLAKLRLLLNFFKQNLRLLNLMDLKFFRRLENNDKNK